MCLVAGSQADSINKNKITLLKLTDLHKTYVAPGLIFNLYLFYFPLTYMSLLPPTDSESESEDDDADDLDEDPSIEHIDINHHGGVNRIRSMPQKPGVVATMSSDSNVNIYDLSSLATSLMNKSPRGPIPSKPTFTYSGHRDEGFAIDWSSVLPGRLATGDCAGDIRLWNMDQSGSTWQIDKKPFKSHTSSIEDIQWSPTEPTVFISASSDRTIKIWDTRDSSKSQISFTAHSDDVNVISWNKKVGYLLASGSDDGSFKVLIEIDYILMIKILFTSILIFP